VATRNPLAILYNDRSVLENHHVAFAYLLLERTECKFYECNATDYATIRELVITIVLSTDNTKHFVELGQLKARMQDKGFPDPSKPDDKKLLMKNVMHACDISNPAKDTAVAVAWTVLVLDEFFKQGDREKEHGIPVSMFMDRDTTNVGMCQVGFMDALVNPLYSALELLFPALRLGMDNMNRTRQFWHSHIELFGDRLKQHDPFPLMDIPGLLDGWSGTHGGATPHSPHSPASHAVHAPLPGVPQHQRSTASSPLTPKHPNTRQESPPNSPAKSTQGRNPFRSASPSGSPVVQVVEPSSADVERKDE